MRCLTLAVIVALASSYSHAQSAPPPDSNVMLHVSIVGDQREFRVGETIPIRLEFSSAIPDRYQINMATYDRSGRMEYERFAATPVNAVVDPLANRRGGSIGGGLTGFKFLTSDPWTIQLNVNEWLRFTKPGKYQLDITSRRVAVRDSTKPSGTSPVMVTANPITLTIIPATSAWEKATLAEAVATLNQQAPVGSAHNDSYYLSFVRALDTIRFLGTLDATRELVDRLGRGDFSNEESICQLGLIGADRDVARQALESAVADPDRPISSSFLYVLATISADPGDRSFNSQFQREALGKILAALPNKRGDALLTTLNTVVNEAWNGAALPKETADALARQLIMMFDQLPPERQSELLDGRWDKIAGPEMLPILRRYAVAYDEQVNVNSINGSALRRLSASALQRWYELDPAGARPAILAEITRPRPRYDARVLGVLQDKTLPEVDAILAEHFTASNALPVAGYVASLIARYGTGAILPPVLAKLDPRLGKWACDIQNPILAYALRVDPTQARPRIEQALAARGNGFSGCYQDMLTAIGAIHFDPILEDIATRGLDDPAPRVVASSATLLGQFGSPRAETALLEHYTKWAEKWAGHESALTLTFAEAGQNDDESAGSSLLRALTTGQSWLTDANTLDRLLPLARGPRLRQILDEDLKRWNDQPLAIVINRPRGSQSVDVHLAQYQLHSMDALQDKLAQFPAGTKFRMTGSGPDTPANRASDAALRTFMSAHQLVVVEK